MANYVLKSVRAGQAEKVAVEMVDEVLKGHSGVQVVEDHKDHLDQGAAGAFVEMVQGEAVFDRAGDMEAVVETMVVDSEAVEIILVPVEVVMAQVAAVHLAAAHVIAATILVEVLVVVVAAMAAAQVVVSVPDHLVHAFKLLISI